MIYRAPLKGLSFDDHCLLVKKGKLSKVLKVDTVKPIIIALLLISHISRYVVVTHILLALIYVQNSITMPHL